MAIPKDEEDIETTLNRSSAWTTTYGDMMSNLMIFFLALFCFYATTNIGKESLTKLLIKGDKPHGAVKIEERQDAPLKKPYVEIVLKKPILLRYENGNLKKGIKETLSQIEDEILEAYNINLEGEVIKPSRKGLYPANWVRRVTINISTDFSDDAEYYIVKKGDTLWEISKRFGKEPKLYDEFAKMNDILDPNMIKEGDILVIPKKDTIKEIKEKKGIKSPAEEIFINIKKKFAKKFKNLSQAKLFALILKQK